LNSSAFVNAQDWKGDTPLHIAVLAKNEEGVRLLMEHTANYTIKNNKLENAYDTAINRGYTTLANLIQELHIKLMNHMASVTNTMRILEAKNIELEKANRELITKLNEFERKRKREEHHEPIIPDE